MSIYVIYKTTVSYINARVMSVMVCGTGTYTVDNYGVLRLDGVSVPELHGIRVETVNGCTFLASVVTSDGDVLLTGQKTRGVLGEYQRDSNYTNPQIVPRRQFANLRVSSVCVSETHVVALAGESVFAKGDALSGALGVGLGHGLGRYVYGFMPVTDDDFCSVPTNRIVTAYSRTLFERTDGSVYTCGDSTGGGLGFGHDDETVYSPKRLHIPATGSIVHMSTTHYQTAFVMENGRVVMWSRNQYGQMGFGDKVARKTPTVHPLLQNIATVSCGINHIVILNQSGDVFVAGRRPIVSVDGVYIKNHSTFQEITGVPRTISVHAGHDRTVLVSDVGTLTEFGVCRDFLKLTGFPVNNTAPRCAQLDPPVHMSYHVARVGMHVYRLSGKLALAFAMLSHARCGVASIWFTLPRDIVRDIVDAAWTPGLDGDPGRLKSACHRF